eukprot:gene8739-14762_t
MSKVDRKHLQCLRDEEKFLLKMQNQLLNQQKRLKVEEAALLRLMSASGTSRGGVGKQGTAAKPETVVSQLECKSSHTTIKSQIDCLDDTVVNVAPLSLHDLTVPSYKEKGLEDSIDQGKELFDAPQEESEHDSDSERDFSEQDDDD